MSSMSKKQQKPTPPGARQEQSSWERTKQCHKSFGQSTSLSSAGGTELARTSYIRITSAPTPYCWRRTEHNPAASKRTKHIRVRYFSTKDRLESDDVTIKHCPTEEMIGDHFTKSLQGTLFHKFRAEVQGRSESLRMTSAMWMELGWDREANKMRELREIPSIPAQSYHVSLHGNGTERKIAGISKILDSPHLQHTSTSLSVSTVRVMLGESADRRQELCAARS
jgi:hypothetical protein